MATVEDIYRKIRRGEPPRPGAVPASDLKAVAVTDNELAAGVERIRARLMKKSATGIRSANASFRKILWVPALAAAAAIVILIWRPWPAKAAAEVWTQANGAAALGQIITLKQGEALRIAEKFVLQALSTAAVKILPDEGSIRRVQMLSGAALVERRDPSLAVTLVTNFAEYSFAGTKFVLETSREREALFMLQGQIFAIAEGRELVVTAEGENTLAATKGKLTVQRLTAAGFARTHPTLVHAAAALPEFAAVKNAPQIEIPKLREKSAYNRGDCVVYYRNNEKRRGKIYGHDATGYTIHGASGPEPGRFAERDLFRSECE